MDNELKKFQILALVAVIMLGVLAVTQVLTTYMWYNRNNPDDGQTVAEAAGSLVNQGELDLAKLLLEARLKTHPHDLYALWYIADLYENTGELEAARKTHLVLIEHAPNWRIDSEAKIRRITAKLDGMQNP